MLKGSKTGVIGFDVFIPRRFSLRNYSFFHEGTSSYMVHATGVIRSPLQVSVAES